MKFVEIMKKNGLLGTFNLNSGIFAPEGTTYPAGTVHRRMSESQILAAYRDSGMEVAVHAYTHPFLEQLPVPAATAEVLRDREKLEEMFGGVIRGMAYPYGTFSPAVVEVLRNCGIAYSRTTRSTGRFGLPQEPLTLDPTCHHNDPRLFELADKFLASKAPRVPELFYLWGHSYEFNDKNNWDLIESFCALVGGKDDVWYCTNIEFMDCMDNFARLQFAADNSFVHNPNAADCWISVNDQEPICIPGGATMKL